MSNLYNKRLIDSMNKKCNTPTLKKFEAYYHNMVGTKQLPDKRSFSLSNNYIRTTAVNVPTNKRKYLLSGNFALFYTGKSMLLNVNNF